MKCRILKIFLPAAIASIVFAQAAWTQVDQFEYERPSLNLMAVYGNGQAGYADGTLDEARFNRPMGAVFFNDYTVIVADTHNRKVRVVMLENEKVQTVECSSASGRECNSEFIFPVDVSCDRDDVCWVLDAGDGSIVRIALDGKFFIAGRYRPMNDSTAVFKGALGILSVGGGLLYIADTYGNRIWKFDTLHDAFEPISGTGQAGFDEKETNAALAPLNNPTSMVGIGSSVMFLDSRNAMIRELYDNNQEKWVVSTFSGGGPFKYLTRNKDLGQVYDFGLPFRMTYTDFNPGLFFISLPGRNQVVALTFERQAYVAVGAGSEGENTQELAKPYAIAAMGNRLLVFDSGNHMRLYSIKREAKE